MAFRVELSPQAFGDLDKISTYIEERSSLAIAAAWFDGIFAAIRSLSEMPSRCPIFEDSKELGVEVRVLLHGKRNRRYKIYFSTQAEDERVIVFHVRHWARKPVEADELEDLMDEGVDLESGTQAN